MRARRTIASLATGILPSLWVNSYSDPINAVNGSALLFSGVVLAWRSTGNTVGTMVRAAVRNGGTTDYGDPSSAHDLAFCRKPFFHSGSSSARMPGQHRFILGGSALLGLAVALRRLHVRAQRRQRQEDEEWERILLRANNSCCNIPMDMEVEPRHSTGAIVNSPSYIVLGSASAIAKQFMDGLYKDGVPCCGVSRHLHDSRYTHRVCDLTDQDAASALGISLAEQWSGSIVVVFATSYKYQEDCAIVSNSLRLARALGASTFIFISSWVAAFGPCAFDFPYRRAKRDMEREVMQQSLSFPGGVHIVRLSNVIGHPELLQQRMLDRFGHVLPRSCTRAYVSIEQVVIVLRSLRAVSGVRVHSVYGKLQSIRGLVATHRRGVALLGPICVPIHVLGNMLVLGLSRVHTYFQGWRFDRALPCNEAELLSFMNQGNDEVLIVGRGAIIDNYRLKSHGAIVVSTHRALRRVCLDVAELRHCHVEAGCTFGEVLAALAPHGLTLSTRPNYNHITIGAAFAGPLHGSNTIAPTIAPIVETVRVYDMSTGLIKETYSGSNDVLLRPDRFIYLSATLRTQERQMWLETKELLGPCGGNRKVLDDILHDLISTSGRESHIEIRSVCPVLGTCWYKHVFTATSEASCRNVSPPRITSDPRTRVGQLWDWKCAEVTLRLGASYFANSEIFVDAAAFVCFMADLHRVCLSSFKCCLTKLVLRPVPWSSVCCEGGTNLNGYAVAVDFCFLLGLHSITVLRDLLVRYQACTAMHPSKYVHRSWPRSCVGIGRVQAIASKLHPASGRAAGA